MSIIGPVFVMDPFGPKPVAAYDNSGGNPTVVAQLRERAVELNSVEDVLYYAAHVNRMRSEAERWTRRAEFMLHAVKQEAHAIIDKFVDSHRSREFYYGLLDDAEQRAFAEYETGKGGWA